MEPQWVRRVAVIGAAAKGGEGNASHVLIVQNMKRDFQPALFVLVVVVMLPSERDKDWAALSLASKETLSAFELHESFTEKSLAAKLLSLTCLLVLCACSSGTQLTIQFLTEWGKEGRRGTSGVIDLCFAQRM